MTSIRFWTLDGRGAELVRLTVHKDRPLTWSRYQRTDEGWTAEEVTYTFDGSSIIREIVDDGTDCDGRLTQENRSEWDGESLHHTSPSFSVRLPIWERVEASQRDYSAERAGY